MTYRTRTSSSNCGRALLALLFMSNPACGPDDDTVDLRVAEIDAEEALLEQQFATWSDARRTAYEEHGIIPDVPPELSDDPADPNFVFSGYAQWLSTEEVEEYESGLAADHPQPEASEEDEPDDDGAFDFGYFVSAAGEIWKWNPVDPSATISKILESVDEFGPEGEPVSHPSTGEGQPISEAEEAFRAIIAAYGDHRQIRSASEGHAMTAYPLRVMGGLQAPGTSDADTAVGCTATKIGPRHLLTAGHCVNVGGQGAGGGWINRAWWPGQDGMHYYKNSGPIAPNGKRSVVFYWVHSSWLNSSEPTRDVAVLRLQDTQANCNLGWFGYEVDNTLAGTSHWNFGFPIWGMSCANSTWPSAPSCRQSMWGESRNIARTTTNYAFYVHATQTGHSGGPVYQVKSGGRFIHAIHKGGYSAVENRGVKINSSVFNSISGAKSAGPSTVCP